MAENNVEEESVMVCPFFLYAKCYRGENCEFAHEMTDILPENVMCDFFLRGMCKYGRKCWFSHNTPGIKSPTKNKNEPNSLIYNNNEPNPLINNNDENNPPINNNEHNSPDKIKMRSSFYARKYVENDIIYIPDDIAKVISEMKQSYADILKKSNKEVPTSFTNKLPMEMCTYYDEGKCPLGRVCPCIHGNKCELCNKYCLDPYSKKQREDHTSECEKELERNMKYSFAIQNSKDKVCGICLEVVYDKERSCLRRFGILEKCNHVFCLQCIREWRRRGKTDDQEPEYMIDQRVMRACPQCRAQCDFVIPSNYWVDSPEEKEELREKFKKSLKSKDCKYFSKGKGKCPFGGLCLYRHATPDGVIVELPPPARRKRRNHQGNIDVLDEVLLWDFIADRENWGQNDFEHLSDLIVDYDLGEYYLI